MRLWLSTALGLLALLILVGMGVYAYDSAQAGTIAGGTTIGGVDVGGMRPAAARHALERQLRPKLERRVTVAADGRTFKLPARRAGVRPEIGAMVADAVAESGQGNPLTRTLRGLTSQGVDVRLRVAYSRRAVAAFVERVKDSVDRPAQDARLAFTATRIHQVRERIGRRIDGRALRRHVTAALLSADGTRLVRARTEVERPKVTKRQLPSRYSRVIVVDRDSFRLRFYRGLRLAKSYPIGVGQAGYDTPSGLYRIQNKAVNPAWSVPNKAWAGSLAGTVVPSGSPRNPLKARWLGVYDGVGVHGTAETWSLGTRASRGCIRMAVSDVVELYQQVPVKTPIYIA